jgi:hypothetical protein
MTTKRIPDARGGAHGEMRFPEILLTDKGRGRLVWTCLVASLLFLAGCAVTIKDERIRTDQQVRIEQRLTGIEERQKAIAAVLNQLPRNPQAKPEVKIIQPK